MFNSNTLYKEAAEDEAYTHMQRETYRLLEKFQRELRLMHLDKGHLHDLSKEMTNDPLHKTWDQLNKVIDKKLNK